MVTTDTAQTITGYKSFTEAGIGKIRNRVIVGDIYTNENVEIRSSGEIILEDSNGNSTG